MSDTITLGGLSLVLERSDVRETVGITVERNGSLVVRAPTGTKRDVVERVVRSRAEWIHTKLAAKEMLLTAWRPKEFVPGEGFAYLGRHYRLRFVDPQSEDDPVLRLLGGWFDLRRDYVDGAADEFAAWYGTRGREWLPARVARWLDRAGVQPGPTDVRDLGFRWGSCGERSINFHWRVMTLPPSSIDYVIAHELVHVTEPNHSREFWTRLGRLMPDFEVRREWLAQHGGDY